MEALRLEEQHKKDDNSMIWKGAALLMCVNPYLRTLWNNDRFLYYVQRWVKCGVYSSPDSCAPVTGYCGGKFCSTSNVALVCGSQPCVWENYTANYGVTFGPDPNSPGACLKDYETCDGIGRFPALSQQYANTGKENSPFVNEVWSVYFNCSDSEVTCDGGNTGLVQTEPTACESKNASNATSPNNESAAASDDKRNVWLNDVANIF